jgi:hypothetical protein
MPPLRTVPRSYPMRPNPLRLLVLALPLLALAGCGTTRSCGSDTDYLQAVERPPIKLPADFTPSERIQPLTIPPVDPNPAKLDPEPQCLDQPPKFFARTAPPPTPAAPAALTAPAATAAPAAAAATAASVAPAAAAATVAPTDGADEVVRAWAAAWASGQPDAVVEMYSGRDLPAALRRGRRAQGNDPGPRGWHLAHRRRAHARSALSGTRPARAPDGGSP